MKILIISHTSVITEYRKRFYYLQKELKNAVIRVIIPDRWNELNKIIKAKKTKIDKNYELKIYTPITFFRKKPLLNTTYFFPQLIKELLDFKPDIIDIIEEPYSFITAYTIFLNKLLKINAKIIFFSAQNIFKNFPFPFNKLQKYVLTNADFSFPINNEVVQVLKKHGYKKKYAILPLGVDIKAFSTNLQYKDTKIRVCFVGRLECFKGVDLFLKLLEESEFQKISFSIIGKGSIKIETKKYNNLNYIPYIPHSKIPIFLKKQHILILPSRKTKNVKEQFGRVIIEAMAAKVLVIGSNVGEIPNIIKDERFIFKENDYEDLKKKLNFCLNLIRNNKTEYKKITTYNFNMVKKLYSWETIAKKTAITYRFLASNKNMKKGAPKKEVIIPTGI